MSLLDRVESLKSKHAELEMAIDDARRRPNSDRITVTELKRRKLKIKDELERLLQ